MSEHIPEYRPQRGLEISRSIAMASGIFALAVALLTLTGWCANIPSLTDWGRGISMLPNTAACHLGAGVGLIALALNRRTAAKAAAIS